MKRLLIKLLFKLLGPLDEFEPKMSPKIEEFMANSWMSPGFRYFCAYREKLIKDSLSGGVGLNGIPRDDYVRQIGQRFEVRRWYFIAEEAWKNQEKGKVKGVDIRKAAISDE